MTLKRDAKDALNRGETARLLAGVTVSSKVKRFSGRADTIDVGRGGDLKVRGGIAFVIAAAFAAALLPAPAFADWTAPRLVSSPEDLALSSHVAVDSDGDAIVVWPSRDSTAEIWTLNARIRSAEGTLGSVQTLASDVRYPLQGEQVAVDGGGDAIVVWENTRDNNIQLRTLSSAGVLGPVHTLAVERDLIQGPQLAVNSMGDAVVVWATASFNTGHYRIQACRVTTAGAVGTVRDLAVGDTDNSFLSDAHVGIDAGGVITAGWMERVGAQDSVRARTLLPGGTLSATQNVAPAGVSGTLQVAVGAAGDVAFTWVQRDEAETDKYVLNSRVRQADGTMQPIQKLSGRFGRTAFQPKVAMRPDGAAIFVWRRHHVQTRIRHANGGLTATQTLSVGDAPALDPDFGIDSSGDAVFIWRLAHGSQAIQARTRAADGSLGPIQTLSQVGMPYPDVAVGPAGDAAATWTLHVHRVQAAFGP